MTAADIHFTNYIEGPGIVGIKADLTPYPKLKTLKGRVEADPNIAAWIEKRPKTPF